MQTAGALVPECSTFRADIATEKLIKFWQKLSKKYVVNNVLRSTNLLILFGIRRTVKTNHKVHIGKDLFHVFSVQDGLKQGDA